MSQVTEYSLAECVLKQTQVTNNLQDANYIMLVNLDAYLNTHESSVRIRAKRAAVLANNLANADTPNFKARDLSFSDALKSATNSAGASMESLAVTKGHSAHISPTGTALETLKYRLPTQYSLDGNTVQTDVEKAEFSENSVRYEASLQLLGGKFSGLIKALKGE